MKFKHYLNESKQRKSMFDSSIKVIILYKNDPEYKEGERQFKYYGVAIGIPKEKIIVWDGEQMKNLNKDEILFTEAHEYAHFALKKFKSNARTEAECDYGAIVKLGEIGKKKAAQIGIDRFTERHGLQFDVSALKGYK